MNGGDSDYLIGDYFLEIRQRLRESKKIGEEILLKKLRKLPTSLTGLTQYRKSQAVCLKYG